MRLIIAATALALTCLLAGEPANAQKIYKWTDDQGRVQYTQTPPPEDVKVESSDMQRNQITPERRHYCGQIRMLAGRLARLRRSGLSMTSASEAMRQVEVSEDLDVDEIALRELVSFVYAGSNARRFRDTDIAGRAQNACIGGSFGKAGRGSIARPKTPGDRATGPNRPRNRPATTGKSSGTGWITGGLIATNHHVIEGHDRYRVRFADGTETEAFLSGADAENDVALLRVGGNLPQGLPIADSEAAIGADVFTLGYPHTSIMGSNAKLSTGIVSSTTGMKDDPRLYQISVPVQSGNSGGPLINGEGEVVGLVTAKLSAAQVFRWTGDLPQNVNYAVKVRYLVNLMRRNAGGGSTDMTAQSGSLEELAARIGPSVVLVIAE